MRRSLLQHGFGSSAVLLLAALFLNAPLSAQDVEADGEHRSNAPVHDPLGAWQQALLSLPPGARVRRLAFAEHILFVFHSTPGDNAVRALTLTPTAQGYFVEEGGERDASICSADGIAPERVEHGLRRVLASDEWQRHAGSLDSLILECWSAQLDWTLLPIPEGGFQEGVVIETVKLPFEPGPESAMPALEME